MPAWSGPEHYQFSGTDSNACWVHWRWAQSALAPLSKPSQQTLGCCWYHRVGGLPNPRGYHVLPRTKLHWKTRRIRGDCTIRPGIPPWYCVHESFQFEQTRSDFRRKTALDVTHWERPSPQAFIRGESVAPLCKTCTHVSYQQISILTLNFKMSFVGHLTNVATLEYFTLTVFFSVFVERCFSCLAWVHRTLHVVGSFDENTRFFSGHGMLFSWIPRKLSSPWYRCCLVDSGGHLLNTCL